MSALNEVGSCRVCQCKMKLRMAGKRYVSVKWSWLWHKIKSVSNEASNSRA